MLIDTIAPTFTLPTVPGQQVSLEQFRGQPVVLAFYPADWSPVCGDQLAQYNTLADEFRKRNAVLLPISVDGIFCHAAYGAHKKFWFPLLADFEPKGRISKLYGAYNDQIGISQRALFVIDADGVIRWSHLSSDSENPGADGIFAALDALPAPLR